MLTDIMKTRLYAIAIISTIAIFFMNSTVYSKEGKILHSKKYSVGQGGRLELKSDFGDVKVSSWSNSDVEIKVFGSEKIADEIKFYFEKTGDNVSVKAEKKRNLSFNFFNYNLLRFEIKVPQKYSSDIATAGGDISVNGLNGEFEFKTSGGDVEMNDNIGKAGVFTSGGDIEIKNHKSNVRAETSGGDIKLQAAGNVICNTSGGDINIIGENGSVNAETSGGDIVLKYWGKNKGISCQTSGGDIKCIVPADFKADVELKTLGGDVEIDFTNANTRKVSHSKFYGKFNGGGEKFECSTSGGNIMVGEATKSTKN